MNETTDNVPPLPDRAPQKATRRRPHTWPNLEPLIDEIGDSLSELRLVGIALNESRAVDGCQSASSARCVLDLVFERLEKQLGRLEVAAMHLNRAPADPIAKARTECDGPLLTDQDDDD